ENFTSSEVTDSPLWKRTLLRRANSYTRPSDDIVHDSARLGAMCLPGIGFSMASWSAYRTMKGVMSPGVSAGSNKVGARVKWSAQVIWPAGASARALGATAT